MMKRLIYYIVIGLLSLISLLPLKVHYFFSNITAFFLGRVFRYRYTVIVTNLSRSFPELRYRQIERLARQYYHHLAEIVAESVWSFTRSTEKIGRNIRIEGVEEVNRACDRNRNVIVMLGHTGNWEIFTGLPDLKKTYGINIENRNFVYAYKRQKDALAEMIIEKIRNRHKACSTVDTHNIIRHIVKNREGRDLIFLLCDQNPEKSVSDTTLRFLNQKTYMIEGPEKIATKMKMPVLYCGLIRNGRKENVAVFETICEDASTCKPGEITARYAAKLERDINNDKISWLWSHKRWKKYLV